MPSIPSEMRCGPPIPANSAGLDFATIHPKDVDTSKLGTLDLNIYTTELFKLPAGGIGFAFGGQFRKRAVDSGYRSVERRRRHYRQFARRQHAGGQEGLGALCGSFGPILQPDLQRPRRLCLGIYGGRPL